MPARMDDDARLCESHPLLVLGDARHPGRRGAVRSRTVTSPSGEQWRVGRVWVGRGLPRWRKVRIGDSAGEAAWMTMPDVGGIDEVEVTIVLVVGALVLAVIVIPLLLFGIELIVLGFVIAAGIVGRGFLGRPWVVRAVPTSGHEPALAWKVVGLRRSHRLIDEVAASLQHGLTPAPAEKCEALLAPGLATD